MCRLSTHNLPQCGRFRDLKQRFSGSRQCPSPPLTPKTACILRVSRRSLDAFRNTAEEFDMKETSKNRHTVWLTDETWKMVGDQYKRRQLLNTKRVHRKSDPVLCRIPKRGVRRLLSSPTRCPICWKEV